MQKREKGSPDQGTRKRDQGLLAENSNTLDFMLMLRASHMEWSRLKGILEEKAGKGLRRQVV